MREGAAKALASNTRHGRDCNSRAGFRPPALPVLFLLVGKKGRRCMENWKAIAGYEGMYEVSDFGRVRSVDREVRRNDGITQVYSSKILKPRTNRGYLSVALSKNGSPRFMAIHRLVGCAFIENPENKLEINHLDENPQNNCATNLVWCTRKENVNWGTCHQRSITHPNFIAATKRLSKRTAQLSLDGQLLKVWDSLRAISRETGYMPRHIAKCCNGKTKTRYGYRWSYI